VHTAVIEIEAIACLEAIVSGLVPVICNSKRSATRYFAIDDCGLYNQGDPVDLCKKIEFFYREPKIKEAYASAYKKKCCAFDQGECMSKMEEMLLTLVKKRV